MSAETRANREARRTPAYVAYKTFKNVLSSLDHVPQTIDYSVFPSMNGSTRSYLFGAFKYLELINDEGVPSDAFRELALASSEDAWKKVMRELIERHYADQLDALQHGTPTTLKKSIGDNIGPSVVAPACRFLIAAATDAGIQVSPSISRGTIGNSGSPRKRRNRKETTPRTGGTDDHHQNQKGMIRFPIPLQGKQAGEIAVPEDLTVDDLPMVQAMFKAVEQYAEQATSKGDDS